MTSKNPDAAIAVQATYNLTISANIDFAVRPSPELDGIIKIKGVPDLKNCKYYFIGNVSNKTDAKNILGKYDEIWNICNGLSDFPTKIITIFDDHQVSTILDLYKAGNFSHEFYQSWPDLLMTVILIINIHKLIFFCVLISYTLKNV